MTAAVPNQPSSVVTSSPSVVKESTPDIIIGKSELPSVEAMFSIAFEDISSQELITIARHDTVNGQPISYRPIQNLEKLEASYGPKSIISMPNSSKAFFDNFAIKLDEAIPLEPTGPNGEHIYFDSRNRLVIEISGIRENELVEVQILEPTASINDIIY